MNITLNQEKNGIEIRFESKPNNNVIEILKSNGFRWSGKQKMWYAKQTEERIETINSISLNCTENKTEKPEKVYNLWDMTRINDDINNAGKELCTKEIAAQIRRHIKERFPMCKFSVRSNPYNISIELLESPFEKDSDELKAIIHYVFKYADSYRYCTNYDPYGDYGSSYNFYGIYENSILSYQYHKREMTVSEANITADFQEQKKQFDKKEKERKEKELQEQLAKQERDEIERQNREKERNLKHEIIETSAVVKNVEYFILNCDSTNRSKEDNIDKYIDDYNGDWEVKHNRINAKISTEVYFNKEVYDIFCKQLLDDYTFLAGKGGSETADIRIKSMTDYYQMSKDEQETVEWYSIDCIAIFCDNELKLVIDPQGYDYARYVFFVDDDSKIVNSYPTAKYDELSYQKSCILADKLLDASADIIIQNSWSEVWDNEKFSEYKKAMKEWIYNNNFPFSVNVIRAIDGNSERFKTAMYRLLAEVDGIQEQFTRAELNDGQKITIIQISDFGGIVQTQAIFKRFQLGSYAQYDNAVKMVFRPKRKKSDYYKWFYRDVLIYDGWVDIPESLMWETFESPSGLTCKKSKFLSCDNKQYDVILDYFKEQGIKPIINTYKPQF